MAKKSKKVYVVLRNKIAYKRMPMVGGDCYYTGSNVNEFIAVFDNKQDAFICSMETCGDCYVKKFKL